MDSVRIGGPEVSLELTCVKRFADGTTELMRAGVHSPSAAAAIDAYEYSGYETLAQFFEALADSWRGWDGERSYESLEGDLKLVAQHDGHVRLTVLLRSIYPPAWSFTSALVLDAGEELAAAARAVRTLVGERHPQ